MMKYLKPILNMLLPTLLFYVLYKAAGILAAILIAAAFSLGSILWSRSKGQKISNSQVLGAVSLLASGAAIVFSGNEKMYYVPALIGNIVLMGFMVWLTVSHKSVLHYLAKDFRIEALEQVPEENMLPVNILWIVFFVLKILSKVLGLLFLNFEKMYWLVFLLGDPMTIVVVIMSVILIRRGCIQE